MITSDKQFQAAKQQLALLAEQNNAAFKDNLPEVVRQAARLQTGELISEIQQAITEYERLKNTSPNNIEIHSLDDLMIAPIRYRIAAHMSLDEFARKVGVSARQIARYELESYQNINIATLRKILLGLNICLDGRLAA